MRVWGIAATALVAAAGVAHAGSNVVKYGPAAAWVAPPPAPTDTAPPEGAAAQFVYNDVQTKLGADHDEFYTSYRIKILKPEALALGNVMAVWNPSSDEIRVHMLKILRDGREIDVLAKTKFGVIQRENNLEAAMLAGDLTANLQTPGLQVGDELQFAATISRRDPTLGDRSQGGMMLPSVGAAGAYRTRLVWPVDRPLQWSASPDLGKLEPVRQGADNVLTLEMRDPKSAIAADGAPLRYNIRRLVQFSSFGGWSEVSNLLWPIYDKAAQLTPTSPIKAEAARIAAAHKDPTARAAAALALVQEQIRYVYIGLDDGNYRPASAEDTWSRRFGDCKAKTVLLLALLRELGIEAEPVLIQSQNDDGLDKRLPMVSAFDHILVRAVIGGRAYWLDGTRMGDLDLKSIPEPDFHWFLPVRAGATSLTAFKPEAPLLAQEGFLLEIDASAGFDAPAKVTAENIVRGDQAFAFKTALAQLSKDDADRALKGYWSKANDWVEPETVGWTYDAVRKQMLLTMTGEGELDWEGDATDGRAFDIPSAGFSPPSPHKRPKEQDQTAPWLTEFPIYRRWTTLIRLPPETGGWKWSFMASPVDDRLGGTAYWRQADLERGVMRTTMTRRVYEPEVSAEEAKLLNKKLPKFDNKVSRIFQYRAADEGPDRPAEETAQDPADLVGIGAYYQTAGKPEKALALADKALAKSPGFRPAVRLKALAIATTSPAKGLAFVDKALKTDDDPVLAIQRGRILAGLGQTDAGLAAMEATFASRDDELEVAEAFADTAQAMGRSDLALKGAERAVKLAPDNIVALRRRAALNIQLGHMEAALADFETAVRLQPEDPINLRNRAYALRRMSRTDEALADLDEALRMNPVDIDTLDAKALALRAAGRGAQAAALYDASIARRRDGWALNSRCWERALANVELKGAESDCAEAVKLEPRDAAYWDSYALVALRDGRLDEALKRYDQALKLEPQQAASLYGRGLVKLRRGDEAGGRGDIAAAKALSAKAGDELDEAGLAPAAKGD